MLSAPMVSAVRPALRADWHVILPRIAAAAAATPSLRRKQDSILTYAAPTNAPTSVPELPPTINKTSLAKLKVPELRALLSERALESSGLKADLVERLLESLTGGGGGGGGAAAAAGAQAAVVSPAADPQAAERGEMGAAQALEAAGRRSSEFGEVRARDLDPGKHWLLDKANPTGVELWFLGTSSGTPTLRRNVSSIACRLEKEIFLVDCGEGTQHQIMKTCLKPGKISNIFITHMHGDHCFGLPGLLCSIGNARFDNPDLRNLPLMIWGPPGIKDLVRTAMAVSKTVVVMPVTVNELSLAPTVDGAWPEARPIGPNMWHRVVPPDQSKAEVMELVRASNGGANMRGESERGRDVPGRGEPELPVRGLTWTLVDTKELSVKSGQLRHRVPCWGYVMQEKDRPGRMDADKCTAMGLQPGPLYKTLVAGEAVTTPEGVTIQPGDVIGQPRPGRKVVILGDTRDSSAIADLAMGADVVTHECTFENSMLPKALIAGHSTAGMAGQFAKSINAKQLLLTHFSARYNAPFAAPRDRPGKQPVAGEDDDDEPVVSAADEARAISMLVREASSTFESNNIEAAHDFFRWPVPKRPEPK